MISRVIRRSKNLCHTAVAAAVPAMISRVIRRSKHLRHTAVAAAAPAMISRVIRHSKHLRHTAVAAVAPAMISCYPPQQTPPSYSGRSGGPGYDIPCYPPQQTAPRPFSSFVRDQRYYGGNSTALPHQPRPRPFSSFGWEQRGACRDGPSVNGLANSIAQEQAQRDIEMDCHGGTVSKMSGPAETTASLARGGPPSQARHQRWLKPPSGTLTTNRRYLGLGL